MKLRNLLRPKTTNIRPNRILAMRVTIFISFSCMCECRCWMLLGPGMDLGGDGADLLDGGLEEGFAVCVGLHELSCAAGGDEGDVGYAEESEDGLEVGLDEVESAKGCADLIGSSGGDED